MGEALAAFSNTHVVDSDDHIIAATVSGGMASSDKSLTRVFSEAVYGAGGRQIQSVFIMRSESSVADGTAIFLLDNHYVLLVAPAAYPGAAEVQHVAMVRMANILGVPLAKMMLPVVGAGYIGLRSFLIVPRCKPLMTGKLLRFFRKRRIAGEMLPWLRQLASVRQDQSGPTNEFRSSLQSLADMVELPDELRNDTRQIDQAIANGEITPRHVPMHGDLWKNNIMQRKNGDLAVIDWTGSTCQGYAIYDLVRLQHSFNLAPAIFAAELAWYCEALDGEKNVKAHLLGALGHYANRLGEFPRNRFIILACNCYSTLRSGLAFNRHAVDLRRSLSTNC